MPEIESPTELSRILYAAILGSRRSRKTPDVEHIAACIGKAPITVYKYLEGELDMPYRVARAIYAILRDNGCAPVEALRCIVTELDPDYTILRLSPSHAPNGDVNDDLRRTVSDIGDIASKLDAALDDGIIDLTESGGISGKIAEAVDDLRGIEAELSYRRAK